MHNNILFPCLIYCLVVSLLGNLSLSVMRSPGFLSVLIISFRDLSILVIYFFYMIYFINNKVQKTLLVSYVCTIFVIILAIAHSILFVGNPIESIVRHVRIIIAIPIMVISFHFIDLNFNILERYRTFVELVIKVFVFICCIEVFLSLAGLHGMYLSIIDFQQYMQNKGTKASIGYGILQYRLLTPAYNPSIGGIFLALIAVYSLKGNRFLLGCISAFLLLLTVSKSGYILFLVLLLPYRLSLALGLSVTVVFFIATFFDVSVVRQYITNQVISINIASALHHLDGLRTGLAQIFSPLGIGSAGTIISNLGSTTIGRESALGLCFASIGFAYLVPLWSSWSSFKQVSSLQAVFMSSYIMLASINEASGSFYIWISGYILSLVLLSTKKSAGTYWLVEPSRK